MQSYSRALILMLAIAVSLWTSNCFAQSDTSTTEGTCKADDPGTCGAEAAVDIENEQYDEEDDEEVDEVDESDCQDQHERCFEWAEIGECFKNPKYMLRQCKRSCLQCPDQAEELRRKNREWTDEELEVGADMGEKQRLGNENFRVSAEQTAARIIEAREHIQTSGLDDKLIDVCKNHHEDCTSWAVAGECEANKGYMLTSCAPACMTCDMLKIEKRCPIDPDAKPAWKPGDLNAMFERLISEPIASKYPVTVLSRDPWVVTIDDVISEDEAQRLIELGGVRGYERSEDVGAIQADGSYGSKVSTGRTSTNAWCLEDCYRDPITLGVIDRLSELTMIDDKHSEYLQLLRYEPGQFYENHHDYIEHNIDNQQGVRILTSYLYLNDVEAGGGTMFSSLNITVMPKRGRALFWPSVLNDSPNEKDERTNHEALPVEAGIKYGANGWYHQYDFKTPFENGCTG